MKIAAGLLSVVFCLSTALGSAESFQNPVRLAAPSVQPITIAVADLNGDGYKDILWLESPSVLSTTLPVKLHTLLGKADGSYTTGPVTALPNRSGSVQAVDVNLDGKPDIVYLRTPNDGSQTTHFAVRFGKGDGSFGNAVETDFLPGDPQSPMVQKAADYNGDGIPDFLLMDFSTGRAKLLTLKANGSMTATNLTAIWSTLVSVQSMDVNGDGKVDLLTGDGTILLNNGQGDFVAPSGDNHTYGNCVFGKIWGETRPVAVCSSTDSSPIDGSAMMRLNIHRSNGDGTFTERVKSYTFASTGTLTAPVAIADLNGDGIPDILASSADGTTIFYGKAADLSFAYPTHYATGYFSDYRPFQQRFYLQIADLNRDGINDLLMPGPDGLYITYGRPDGVPDTARAYEIADTVAGMVVADFDGDGIPDILSTGEQDLNLSHGIGNGSFAYRTPITIPAYTFALNPILGDFNGDKHQDLVLNAKNADGAYTPILLRGRDNGSFTTPLAATIAGTKQPLSLLNNPTPLDLNHDGKTDLLSMNTATILGNLSKGDGSFQQIATTLTNVDTDIPTSASVPGDFHGTGNYDLAAGGAQNLFVYQGKTGGAFNPTPTLYPIPNYKSINSYGTNAVAAADFDGDGHPDIALLTAQQVLFIYYNKGDGSFQAAIPVAVLNHDYGTMQAVDLNKDGLSDLLFTRSSQVSADSAVGIVHNLGARKFSAEVNYAGAPWNQNTAVADLNGDGLPDLLFLNENANAVTVLMNQGNAKNLSGSVYALTTPILTTSTVQVAASIASPNVTLTGNVTFLLDGNPVGTAALVHNQAKLILPSTLAAGVHTLSATWPGDATYAALTLNGKLSVIAKYPVDLTLASTLAASGFQNKIQFKTAASSIYGTPTGSVSFWDGTTALGTMALTNGQATFTPPLLHVARHTITAKFLPTGNWGAASEYMTQEILKTTPTLTLTPTKSTYYAMEPIPLTVTMKPSTNPPTGTIDVLGHFPPVHLSGPATLSNGVANLIVRMDTPGPDSISTEYNGDSDYNEGSAGKNLKITINSTTSTLSASPANTAPYGNHVYFTAKTLCTTVPSLVPTGTTSFYDNGKLLGRNTVTSGSSTYLISTLAIGTHTIQAVYDGDVAYAPSTAPTISFTITKPATVVTLAATPNPVQSGKSVAIVASVASATAPTGQVQFYDGSKTLGSPITVSLKATATLNTSSLTIGSHSITAKYLGDKYVSPATSAAYTLTVTR